jgi:hypothetical protein
MVALLKFQQGPSGALTGTSSIVSFSASFVDGKGPTPRFKTVQLELTKDILRAVRGTSGFSQLVKQSQQLLDPDVERWLRNPERSDEERLCVLLNLNNLMTLHGLVVKGPPSNAMAALVSRSLFQTNVQYMLGTMILDLTQVEHSLLRAGLSPASVGIFGSSLGSPARAFPTHDPRQMLRVQHPPAQLSFGLCTGTLSSPGLFVFRNPERIHDDLDICAALYLEERVRIDVKEKKVYISEYLQWFSKDFGETKREALQAWFKIMGLKDFSDFKVKVDQYRWDLGLGLVQASS